MVTILTISHDVGLNQNKGKSKATLRNCSYDKVLWKYAANLQENTHAKVRFQ